MADFEIALSEGPNVKDLKIVWTPETGLPKIQSTGSSSGVLAKYKPQDVLQEKNLVDGLYVPPLDPKKQRKLARKNVKETAGAKWFNMPAPTITPELKKDLQLLKLRGVVDPKRHYKANDTKGVPKFFQVGRVVEGTAEFYSGRLTKKERKQTFADELLSSTQLKAYRKRKYLEIQDQKQQGGKKFYNQKKNRQKPSFAKD
ncbi:rRNA-processing protein fcf2 [Physcomitrium patens]|uniref:Fcf2 pre-rRNA processing C-terminal domain-containing protein n=1 Tax=Physcomitrium patens TaxID=3218 RepID=A0A2K1K9Q8_PHYPA|nr:rRNA-processing protein fcf2-like [Physcomitrium patens]PNR50518.1 hypothetical protein PHYPA_009704 [Physcomitrium patens]|eukprot:XP_024379873.1 rRNA-processing protein fcf2-like [Physcomitrella patens]